jgi:riboflavin synthase
MFTGIIEEKGIVTSVVRGAQSAKLTISASKAFVESKIGDSIAVNGACLTLTNARRSFMEFDVSSETLKRTTLRDLKIGDKVNLERALAIAGRLGGHLVTGHVDGVGEIRNKINAGKDEFELHISLPSELLRYLVPKGSITIDGVSLTIADLRNGLLVISVVPHTARASNLGERNMGDRVNIEVDILSKYIEKHLQKGAKGITEDSLVRGGFLPMGFVEN